METFSALLAIYAGNSPVPGEFPAQTRKMFPFDDAIMKYASASLNVLNPWSYEMNNVSLTQIRVICFRQFTLGFITLYTK